jgi:hypothetical protein
MEIILAIFGVTAMLVIGSIWRGYVFSVLWKWFIVPVFPAMPLLSIPVAIGIAMVVSFLAYQYTYTKDDRSEAAKLGGAFGVSLLYPGLVLLMGWVVTLFL